MALKILAFIYRHTGYYSPLIKVYQYDAVIEYIKECNYDISELGIHLFIGCWQTNHGLYKTHRRFK
jgi:hypothetical protein